MTNKNKDGFEIRVGDKAIGRFTEYKPIEHRDKQVPVFTLGADRPCVICGEKDCGHLRAPKKFVPGTMKVSFGFTLSRDFTAEIPPADMRNVLQAMEDEKHPYSMGCTVEEPHCTICEKKED